MADGLDLRLEALSPEAPPARVETASVTSVAGGQLSADERLALDPTRLLADAAATDAFTRFVGRLRALRFDGRSLEPSADEPEAPTLADLARGGILDEEAVRRALGPDDVDALVGAHAVYVQGGNAALTAKLFPMRSVYTVLPRPRLGADIVYLGPDSICLLDVVWSARGFGDRAADLGTGNGFLGAALATRYDHVVAADLSARCAATAALVPVLNPQLRGRFSSIVADVAAGLEPGTFDLVTANAPWVPEAPDPDGTGLRRFAAGGPTGFELPRRFLDEAAALLTAGGRAFVACSDLTFEDGRRPLADHVEVLRDRGCAVELVETAINQRHDFGEWAARKAPGAVAARHVVVSLTRA